MILWPTLCVSPCTGVHLVVKSHAHAAIVSRLKKMTLVPAAAWQLTMPLMPMMALQLVQLSSAHVHAYAAACNLTLVSDACFEGGTIKSEPTATSVGLCCSACAALSACSHFTFNRFQSPDGRCRLKQGSMGKSTPSSNCTSGTAPSPPPAPPPPPIPPPSPPNPHAPRPHLVFVLADDLGFFDTAIYNPNSPTTHLAALAAKGIRLDHHYVFRYCSPTRRSFLRLARARARAIKLHAVSCNVQRASLHVHVYFDSS